MRLVTVGTNFVTDRFIEETKTIDGFVLYGIHSRERQRAEKYALSHQIEHAYWSYEDVAKDPNVEAVYLAVPTSRHADLSEYFLRHGKAVLCEKPSASNVKELTRVLSVAEENGTLFMEAYMTSFLPNFQVVKEAKRQIGAIRHASFRFKKYSSRYDAFLRGERPNTFLPEYSNGAAMDLGIYCVYPSLILFGKPEAVTATATLAFTGVDLQGKCVMKYNGFAVDLQYSKILTDESPCVIEGETGRIEIGGRISEPTSVRLITADETVDLTREQNAVMTYEAKAFLQLFEQGRTRPDVNIHALSLDALRVLDEIRRQTGVIYPADR